MKKLMKYALLFTLLCSTSVFAQDFNADLLVGNWQCEGQTIEQNANKIMEKYVVKYQANGTYLSKSTLIDTIESQPVVMKVKILGNWRIANGQYSANTEKLLDFITNNPKIEKMYQFEQNFREDKSTYHYTILELSQNTFKYNFNEDGITGVYECKRTNKKLVF